MRYFRKGGDMKERNPVVIVSAVRTPFGKFGGSLKDIPSIDLGAMVIRIEKEGWW